MDWTDTETTRGADVVLPGSTYLETAGTRCSFEGTLLSYSRVVEPPAGAAGDEVLKGLARALGVAAPGDAAAAVDCVVREKLGELVRFYWNTGEERTACEKPRLVADGRRRPDRLDPAPADAWGKVQARDPGGRHRPVPGEKLAARAGGPDMIRLENLYSFLESSFDYLLVVDGEERVVHASRRLLRDTLSGDGSIDGKPLRELLEPSSLATFRSAMAQAAAGSRATAVFSGPGEPSLPIHLHAGCGRTDGGDVFLFFGNRLETFRESQDWEKERADQGALLPLRGLRVDRGLGLDPRVLHRALPHHLRRHAPPRRGDRPFRLPGDRVRPDAGLAQRDLDAHRRRRAGPGGDPRRLPRREAAAPPRGAADARRDRADAERRPRAQGAPGGDREAREGARRAEAQARPRQLLH